MVNRGAVLVKYKEPFIKWVNEADPIKEGSEMTLEMANDDRTVYLISDRDAENIEVWIRKNYSTLFEDELEGWYSDEALWPKKRDFKTFSEWFAVECHSLVLDTVGGQIFDDEI
jgi:hypothetical protein